MINLKKGIVYSVVIFIAVSISYIGAKSLGEYINEKKQNEKFEYLKANLGDSLKYIENVYAYDIGDTLIDHTFEDLKRNPVKLSEVVQDKSLIVYIDPGCGGCEDEILDIQNAISNSSKYTNVVYITSGNPRLLEDLVNEYNIKSPVLYDHRGMFLKSSNLIIYPYNIITNKELVVLDLNGGSIPEKMLSDFIESL